MVQDKNVRDVDQRFRVMNWIGIINQLSETLANRALGSTDLSFTQFKTLLHFLARDPEMHTVMQVARAFQQPQPGTTKTIQKLEKKGLLLSNTHPDDKRAKLFSITPQGRRLMSKAQSELAPLLDWIFDEWEDEAVKSLFQNLDKIKTHLDTNREGGLS